jgi:Gluconate 2-dehydrogenase subunit 3
MTINRRTLIKQFLFVAAGAAIVPACVQEDKNKSSLLLKNFVLTGEQEQALVELAETIIPETSTPGAKSVYAHLFVLKMIDDCYTKEDQQKFVKGLDLLNEAARKKHDQSFAKCSKDQRAELVAAINGKTDIDSNLAYCYATAKQLTIQGYTSSKFYLTNVQVFKMIPGKYRGCIPAKSI